jgi:hypothetical protein
VARACYPGSAAVFLGGFRRDAAMQFIGETLTDIGRSYGVSQSTISRL